MNRGFSVWLDVLRAGAMLLVVFSHFAYPRFTDGTYQWMRDELCPKVSDEQIRRRFEVA